MRIAHYATLVWLQLLAPCLFADEFEDHWAFQPIRDFSPPAVDSSWVQSPIDAFVFRKLNRAGLQPAQLATRRDFIRRAHTVLTGLPPNYDELNTWLADERLEDIVINEIIERLLASPAFGIRWGRHWLDVARYSDTKGYAYAVEQFDFYHAWRYRDWVVDSLNADLPYDKFIECQIAADRLLEKGKCEPGDLAAMAFLTMGRRFLGVEQDIVDDRIDVVTRSVLGLTVSCARCHDHKFDPVSTRDYYALYGVFKSSREKLMPLASFAEDAELAKLHKQFVDLFNREADAAEKAFLKRVDEYLLAALDISTVPPPAFSEIVLADAVVPAQIRRWHEYLSLDDKVPHPVFAPWKALEKSDPANYESALRSVAEITNKIVLERLSAEPLASMEDVARRYARLFQDAANAKDSETFAEIYAVMRAPDSPLVITRDHPHDVEWLFTNDSQSAIKKAFASYERRLYALGDKAAFTVALVDRAVPVNMPVLHRGEYLNQGDEVERGTLSILGEQKDLATGSGRLEMARAFAHPKNPLTARVIVNRIWHNYFGTGLVDTNSDFGLRADKPSHPELLDYLASHLIANNWSLKSIHRLIANSAVFRQAAGAPPPSDSGNRVLSVYPRRRLDFEAMRDALLKVSGELDLRLGGSPSPLFGNDATPRRSLYGKIDRQFLPGELQVFDFANPELHSPRRFETNVPQQALFFLNSTFTMKRAKALVAGIGDGPDEDRVREIFRRVYQRHPSPKQMNASLEFVRSAGRNAAEEPAAHRSKDWQYGYGKIAMEKGKVSNFVDLPHFNGSQWSGGGKWPDAELGWVRLTAGGGHVGNDRDHAAIRRWKAPANMRVNIIGTVEKVEQCGDGLRAFVTSSSPAKTGSLSEVRVEFGRRVAVEINDIQVVEGEALDFVVDCGEADNFSCDGFQWRIRITETVAGGALRVWDSQRDFSGPPEARLVLGPWERFAHALLVSNEFMYLD